MGRLKKFKQFLNESHTYNDFENEYLTIERKDNGLNLKLKPDGINYLRDIKEELDSLHESDFIDIFDTIQANSELIFHGDLGSSGFGLTEAPGITDGFFLNEDGDWEDNGEGELYYYNDYMVDNFLDSLLNGETVFFNRQN